MLTPTPILGGAYVSRSRILNAQRCINLYPELVETRDGKEVGALYGTPGKVRKVTVGSGPIRGERVVNGTLYVVSGDKFYRVSTSYSVTELGTLLTSTGPVQMVNNPKQILLVDGGQAYGYDTTTNVFGSIPLPVGNDNPFTCAYQDGFALINQAGTEQWWQSNLNDVFNWDALNFSSADGQPDPIVAMVDVRREVWLIGATTTEVWINAGNPGFAFQRLQGVFIQAGCAATASAVRAGQSVIWLGQTSEGNCEVYMSRGYSPERISTHAIEREFQSYPLIADAIAYYYQQEGHGFYVLTFPAADKTWCYDMVTGLWHERGSWDDGEFHRDRSNCYAFLNGAHLVGDFEDGRVYALDLDEFTDDGAVLKRLRSWAATTTGKTTLNNVKYNQLQVWFEPGVGHELPPGVNPQVMLRVSNDGGMSFIGDEWWRGLGRIGQVDYRTRWQRLGSGRDRVFEISMTDPVKWGVIAALVDREEGVS